jgi:hypothetical protein
MLKRCLVSAAPLIVTLLFHVLPLSEGKETNQSCIDAAIAKAQVEGATLGEQAAVKTLDFALAACESSDDYTIFADTGRCGLGIWTAQLLAEDATVQDAQDVVINQCKKVYSHALCTEVGTELFNGHYADLSVAFNAVPGGDFCLSAEELLRAEYFHNKGMNNAALLKGGTEKLMRCFPGDSTVMRQVPEGVQEIPLRDLKIGDSVQSADIATGLTFFTKVLGDWRNEDDHAQQNVEFIRLVHASGSLTITESHFVAIDGGRFVPAMDVMLGDKLVIQTGQSLSNSEVVAIEKVVKDGPYSPFTWHGQLLVDGVLASAYVVPTGFSEALKNKLVSLVGWDALYSVIHVIFLPFRIAHASHIPAMLTNIAFVPGVPWLVCQFYSCAESASMTESESVPGYVIKIRDFMHFGLNALS